MVRALADGAVRIGGYASVPAIYNAPHATMLGTLDANVPAITIALADYPGIERGETVERGAEEYRVVGIEPDGHGLVTLRLEPVA